MKGMEGLTLANPRGVINLPSGGPAPGLQGANSVPAFPADAWWPGLSSRKKRFQKPYLQTLKATFSRGRLSCIYGTEFPRLKTSRQKPVSRGVASHRVLEVEMEEQGLCKCVLCDMTPIHWLDLGFINTFNRCF